MVIELTLHWPIFQESCSSTGVWTLLGCFLLLRAEKANLNPGWTDWSSLPEVMTMTASRVKPNPNLICTWWNKSPLVSEESGGFGSSQSDNSHLSLLWDGLEFIDLSGWVRYGKRSYDNQRGKGLSGCEIGKRSPNRHREETFPLSPVPFSPYWLKRYWVRPRRGQDKSYPGLLFCLFSIPHRKVKEVGALLLNYLQKIFWNIIHSVFLPNFKEFLCIVRNDTIKVDLILFPPNKTNEQGQ